MAKVKGRGLGNEMLSLLSPCDVSNGVCWSKMKFGCKVRLDYGVSPGGLIDLISVV